LADVLSAGTSLALVSSVFQGGQMRVVRARAGFTLIEVMIVVAIIGIFALVAIPKLNEWFDNVRTKGVARSIGDVFLLARSEAMRTGNNHVVFFGAPGTQDPAGNDIEDDDGNWVPLLILNDGPPATANCVIDGGEAFQAIHIDGIEQVDFGTSQATGQAPADTGAGAYDSYGVSFTDAANNPIPWILFRPDGVPVAFTGAGGDCGVVEPTGSGAGGIYVTTGQIDYGVVLAPLGGIRVHAWRPDAGDWSS
jgi:prepilin-type N-terminal cleavage/methylation domain-containing protein